MNTTAPRRLFSAFGIELEYMIVGARSLAVRPIADQVLRDATGQVVSDVARGGFGWSNELVLHLVELKTSRPPPTLDGLAAGFQAEVGALDQRLGVVDARLMPGGMHPWMQPRKETRLWPHAGGEIYRAFDQVFDCRQHGWANLQSMHLNLPFGDDEEFARLHAATRLLLPLLPALAASSPIREGQITPALDHRLESYRTNASHIPSITGRVIPEPVFSREEYETTILRPMYDDIAPYDPPGRLQDEFLNARGAIPRFERGSLEIRLMDMQECPLADLAIAAAVVAVLRAAVEAQWADFASQSAFATSPLEALLRATIAEAGEAKITDAAYLRALGASHRGCLSAAQLWRHLLSEVSLPATADRSRWEQALDCILEHGCLAHRILRALQGSTAPVRLRETYRRLCDCLATGSLFTG